MTLVSNFLVPVAIIWPSEQKRFESSAEGCQRWRRRNLRLQALPHLRASNRICSVANSRAVNRRLDEAVAAERAKSLASRKVTIKRNTLAAMGSKNLRICASCRTQTVYERQSVNRPASTVHQRTIESSRSGREIYCRQVSASSDNPARRQADSRSIVAAITTSRLQRLKRNQSINQSIKQCYSAPKIDQRAGQLGLPHVGIWEIYQSLLTNTFQRLCSRLTALWRYINFVLLLLLLLLLLVDHAYTKIHKQKNKHGV